MITRRNFLVSASAAIICAPPIVRASNLMPLRGIIVPKALHFGFVDRLLVHTHLPHITRVQNEGYSLQEVATELNRRGPKPWRKGETWDLQGVKFILSWDEQIRRADAYWRAVRHMQI